MQPKLRFPEFSGDYEELLIKDIAKITTGNKDTKDRVDCASYPFFVRSDNIEKIDSYSLDCEAVLTSGDGVGVGKNFHYINGKFDFHQRVYCIYDFTPNIMGKYFYYFFSTKFFSRVRRLSAKNSVDSVRLSMISEMNMIHPTIVEQTKIADFLSAVDKKITLLEQQQQTWKNYKQGMMQKLFSGELRFKDENGQDFPEWEESDLRSIAIKIKDGTHFSPPTSNEGEYKYLTSKNVKDGFIDLTNLEFISKQDHVKIYSSCDVKYGDVLLTKDGTIGQSCVNTLKEEFSLLSSVAYIRLKPNYDNYFLYHLLVSSIGQREITKAIAGQALKRITLTKINEFSFNFPCLEEQQKIANCLSGLDTKINNITEQLDKIREWKKGLLQQMFV